MIKFEGCKVGMKVLLNHAPGGNIFSTRILENKIGIILSTNKKERTILVDLQDGTLPWGCKEFDGIMYSAQNHKNINTKSLKLLTFIW